MLSIRCLLVEDVYRDLCTCKRNKIHFQGTYWYKRTDNETMFTWSSGIMATDMFLYAVLGGFFTQTWSNIKDRYLMKIKVREALKALCYFNMHYT